MKIDTLQQILEQSNSIVFFGGAGVSTESGIPDYRSQDGLYKQNYKYPPEVMLSHTFFIKRPEEFYAFYRDKMIHPEAKPNAAHKFLAKLEQAGKLTAIITQNIDGLHQKAGSKEVLELHGTILRNYCMDCKKPYDLTAVTECEGVPRCACGGIIRPEVVLYEEGLDHQVIQRAVRHLAQADAVIVGGTSLGVYPAASLIHYYKGDRLVLINKTPTPMDKKANLLIHDSLGAVFQQLKIG